MVALLKSAPSLRLSNEDDRRMFPRKASSLTVFVRRIDHTLRARLQPQLQLALRDLSAGGLCAVSPTPLSAGERLAVSFPHDGPRPAWDAFGRVLRCAPCGMGYTVALAFDPLPAA